MVTGAGLTVLAQPDPAAGQSLEAPCASTLAPGDADAHMIMRCSELEHLERLLPWDLIVSGDFS